MTPCRHLWTSAPGNPDDSYNYAQGIWERARGRHRCINCGRQRVRIENVATMKWSYRMVREGVSNA